MNDITKLPKWAQSRIQVLEQNVEYHEKRAYAVTISEEEGVVASNTEVGPSLSNPRRFLPSNETIRFHGTSGHIDVRVDDSGDGIQIRGYNSIRVMPSSTNAISVVLAERWK